MAVNNINGANHATPSLISDSRGATPAANNGGQGAQAGAAPASDSVTLTSTASQLRSLEQQLASVPVVDAQRVNSVRSEIASGTFVIDPPRVADKMIQIEGMISARA